MSHLSDEDRERARQVAAAMPEWTDDELAELTRIANSGTRAA